VTRDGQLVAFHDPVLERMTGRADVLADLRADEIAELRIAGDHAVPSMAELLEELPDCRFNVDLKAPAAVAALAELIDRTEAHERVCVGSFSSRSMQQFRRLTGGRVATAATPREVALFLASSWVGVSRLVRRRRFAVLQVPHMLPRGGERFPLVTRALVRRAHAAGVHLHVWTVDDPAEMEQLVDLGVDGLITDRTDLLKQVLIDRGLWREP
jgi:glycerophosphoryl diester phosphodiesterase